MPSKSINPNFIFNAELGHISYAFMRAFHNVNNKICVKYTVRLLVTFKKSKKWGNHELYKLVARK